VPVRLPAPWAGNAARFQFIFSKLNTLNGLSARFLPQLRCGLPTKRLSISIHF
jgi:hypothetical protein